MLLSFIQFSMYGLVCFARCDSSRNLARARFQALRETSYLLLQVSLLVGLSGLEPPTSRLSGVRSNRLSYKPIFPASRLSGHPATVAVPLLLRSSGASFDSPASLRRFPSLRFSAGQNRALPVVEINGIEPLTSCLQSRRSPS